MAFRRLDKTIGITPEKLVETPYETIAEIIRPAGMFNKRSKVLKKISEEILERFGGDLNSVINKPYLDARKDLMSLTGVGFKTADVVLMFVAGKRIVPVDRHIFRISRRLGIVPLAAKYDEVRNAWEEASSPDKREDLHVSLIQFGRDVCRSRFPLCQECFLEGLCIYPDKNS